VVSARKNTCTGKSHGLLLLATGGEVTAGKTACGLIVIVGDAPTGGEQEDHDNQGSAMCHETHKRGAQINGSCGR
jgi:hypothetical protein